MTGSPARDLALQALTRVERGAHSDRTLDRLLRERELDDRDRRLITELVYGTLRRRRSLDLDLARLCDRPLDRLDDDVLCALRLGAYQLRSLDRVPPHAAVDETVRSLKRRRARAAGLVNGVLRSWIRARDRGELPSQRADLPPGVRLDAPDWWIDRWTERYGPAATERWFAAAGEPAVLALRPHPRILEPKRLEEAMARHGVELEESPRCPGAWRVVSGRPMATEPFREGAFGLRSEASQMVVGLLDAAAGERVLDACCGRGGKSIQWAEESGPVVVAVDRDCRRVGRCRDLARRARVPEVRPLVADLRRPVPLTGSVAAALVDAPCSGLGTVRRRPEIRWRAGEAGLERLAKLQRRILRRCAEALSPGGRLLYVTCSTEPEENEEVVEGILAERSDLEREPVRLPDGFDPALAGPDGYFRTFPTFPDLDGFFAARLVRHR